jgi:hypothetical protein
MIYDTDTRAYLGDQLNAEVSLTQPRGFHKRSNGHAPPIEHPEDFRYDMIETDAWDVFCGSCSELFPRRPLRSSRSSRTVDWDSI